MMENIRICIVVAGGIGDGICVTPSIKALRKKYLNCELTVLSSTLLSSVYENNPNIDHLIIKGRETETLVFQCNRFNFIFYTFDPILRHKPIPKKDIIGQKMGLNVSNYNNEIFFKDSELDEAHKFINNFKNPVILHPSSNDIRKNWYPERWEKLVSKFPGYQFIQLGLSQDPLIEGTIDLRGRTTVRQAIALLYFSWFLVGTDSFLNHASNALGIRSVILFGKSLPCVWGYKENINIYKACNCSPCSTETVCNHYQCMNLITVEDVECAIKSILDKRDGLSKRK